MSGFIFSTPVTNISRGLGSFFLCFLFVSIDSFASLSDSSRRPLNLLLSEYSLGFGCRWGLLFSFSGLLLLFLLVTTCHSVLELGNGRGRNEVEYNV